MKSLLYFPRSKEQIVIQKGKWFCVLYKPPMPFFLSPASHKLKSLLRGVEFSPPSAAGRQEDIPYKDTKKVLAWVKQSNKEHLSDLPPLFLIFSPILFLSSSICTPQDLKTWRYYCGKHRDYYQSKFSEEIWSWIAYIPKDYPINMKSSVRKAKQNQFSSTWFYKSEKSNAKNNCICQHSAKVSILFYF